MLELLENVDNAIEKLSVKSESDLSYERNLESRLENLQKTQFSYMGKHKTKS